jgi:hypothetical protein
MMQAPREFHYRLPQRAGGWRPGAHRGTTLGAGQAFVSHARLTDAPDPRRLDLRASLRTPGDDWLVRVHRQRVGITVQAVVDVSASMRFGTPRSKLQVAADFVQSLGASAFRAGDAAGLLAFDEHWRADLFLPARHGRGIGEAMAARLAASAGGAGGIVGLQEAARQLAGRQALVFVVSDFHWPLDGLRGVLDALAHAHVVPLVLWDAAELAPPRGDGLARLADAESGRQRTLWLRPALRRAWHDAVQGRREALARAFAARGVRPVFMVGGFDADALTRHFLGGLT